MASEYFLEPEINLVTENTENILSEGKRGVWGTRGQGHREVLGERARPGKGGSWGEWVEEKKWRLQRRQSG